MALSSCEAEYIVGSFAACQAIWLDSLLMEIKINEKKPMQLLVYNKFAINMAKNSVSHGRSKYIETKFYFLWEQVNKGIIEIVYCPTKLQTNDVLTKAMKAKRSKKLRKELGVLAL